MARIMKATNAYGTEIHFAVGGRQLVAGSLMVFTLAMLTSIGVNVVSQMVQPPSAVAQEADPNEQILLVEPAASEQPSAEEAGVIAVEPIAEAEPERSAAVQTDPESFYRTTRAGELYLQAVATRRSMAGVFAMYLNEEGIPAGFAEASKDGLYRVLAGPIETNAQLNSLHAQLEQLGFQPFVRRVRKDGD